MTGAPVRVTMSTYLIDDCGFVNISDHSIMKEALRTASFDRPLPPFNVVNIARLAKVAIFIPIHSIIRGEGGFHFLPNLFQHVISVVHCNIGYLLMGSMVR